MTTGLTIIFRHPRVVAIDKPSGLLSVPGRVPAHQDSVLTRAKVQFPGATGSIIVHRLDWETSGVMLLALDPDAHARLGRQFEKRVVRKTYVAVLGGHVQDDEGEVRVPIRPDWSRRPYQIVDHERGREAITTFRVLSRDAGSTRVEFTPLTGRTHQLRVHAALALGHPILGDGLYGDRASAPRLLLHAAAIEFFEPVAGRGGRIRVESTVPF